MIDAAQQTRDPRLAQRAAEMALRARARPEDTLAAVRLWRELATRLRRGGAVLPGPGGAGRQTWPKPKPFSRERLQKPDAGGRAASRCIQVQQYLARAPRTRRPRAMLERAAGAVRQDLRGAHACWRRTRFAQRRQRGRARAGARRAGAEARFRNRRTDAGPGHAGPGAGGAAAGDASWRPIPKRAKCAPRTPACWSSAKAVRAGARNEFAELLDDAARRPGHAVCAGHAVDAAGRRSRRPKNISRSFIEVLDAAARTKSATCRKRAADAGRSWPRSAATCKAAAAGSTRSSSDDPATPFCRAAQARAADGRQGDVTGARAAAGRRSSRADAGRPGPGGAGRRPDPARRRPARGGLRAAARGAQTLSRPIPTCCTTSRCWRKRPGAST